MLSGCKVWILRIPDHTQEILAWEFLVLLLTQWTESSPGTEPDRQMKATCALPFKSTSIAGHRIRSLPLGFFIKYSSHIKMFTCGTFVPLKHFFQNFISYSGIIRAVIPVLIIRFFRTGGTGGWIHWSTHGSRILNSDVRQNEWFWLLRETDPFID